MTRQEEQSPGFSLKTAWYGLIILLAVLPLSVALLWAGAQAHSLLLETALLREAQHNFGIATHVEQEANRLFTMMSNKSDPIAHVLTTGNDNGLLTRLFATVLDREPALHSLSLIDPEGNVLAARRRGSTQANLYAPTSPETVVPMHGRPYVGSSFELDGRSMFTIAVPVLEDGVPIAVLIAEVGAQDLWNSLQPEMSRPSVVTYFVDSRGSLMTSARPIGSRGSRLLTHLGIVRSHLAREDWNVQDEYTGLSETPVYGMSDHIALLNWGVISEVPATTIDGPIARRMGRFALLGALFIAMLAALAISSIRKITKTITELARSFERAEKGDYSGRADPSSVKELDTLASGFNSMLLEINARESSLSDQRQALEDSRDRLRRHAEQQTAVAVLGQLALTCSLDELIGEALDLVVRTLDVPLSQVLELQADGESLLLRAGVGWGEGLVGVALVPAQPASVAGLTLGSAEPILVDDLAAERFSESKLLLDHGVVSGVSVLIHGEQGPFGVLGAHTTRPRAFTEDDASVLLAIARILGAAVSRAQAEHERRRYEAMLRQQQKLESIGTLAGGVAHEINNPISGIIGYATLIEERLEPESALREFAEEIGHEGARVAEIVRNLLSFARRESSSHSPVLVSDIINNTLSLIRTIIRRDQIDLQIVVDDGLPKLSCHSQQIQQVLMNLFTNGRDALNARYEGHDDNKIMALHAKLFHNNDEQWIRITVEDHGIGIPKDIADRVFDPFFTNKDRATGTGLGLSVSRGIVEEHHGRLHFESEPNVRTCFHLELPVDNAWAPRSPHAQEDS